jgi:hypothetical protein
MKRLILLAVLSLFTVASGTEFSGMHAMSNAHQKNPSAKLFDGTPGPPPAPQCWDHPKPKECK